MTAILEAFVGYPNWSTTITGIGPFAPNVRPSAQVVSVLDLSSPNLNFPTIPDWPRDLPPALPELDGVRGPFSTGAPAISPAPDGESPRKHRIKRHRKSCRVRERPRICCNRLMRVTITASPALLYFWWTLVQSVPVSVGKLPIAQHHRYHLDPIISSLSSGCLRRKFN